MRVQEADAPRLHRRNRFSRAVETAKDIQSLVDPFYRLLFDGFSSTGLNYIRNMADWLDSATHVSVDAMVPCSCTGFGHHRSSGSIASWEMERLYFRHRFWRLLTFIIDDAKMFWGRSEPDSISTINDDDDDDESSRFLFPEMSTAILRDTPMPTMNTFLKKYLFYYLL